MIFVDVGAHTGETLMEATKQRWGFDHLYAFEPMPREFLRLKERFGNQRRITLLQCGLSDATEVLPFYGANDRMEATLFDLKQGVDSSVVTYCRVVEAAWFFKVMLPEAPEAIVKLNCEGAEVAILDNLLDSGMIDRVRHVMIDFDIRYVPGREREEQRLMMKMEQHHFRRFSLSYEMEGADHQERTASWLEKALR